MGLPKLHASTVVFLLLVAAVLLLANIPGQLVFEPDMGSGGKLGWDFRLDVKWHHGWPLTFLVREAAAPLSPWNLSQRVVEDNWSRLTVDVSVGLVVFFIAGIGFENGAVAVGVSSYV